jgi:hypothetical protein
MGSNRSTSVVLVMLIALGALATAACGNSESHGSNVTFSCQAVCNSAQGEVGGESGEFSSATIDEAERDCVNNQTRNPDLCQGIGTFAGRCSCE